MNAIGFLRSTLLDSSSLSLMVGQRVYFNSAPINTRYPLINLTPISEIPNNTLSGEARNQTRERVQIDCWADTYESLCELNKALNEALSVTDAVCLSRDFSADEKRGIYRYINDYSIWIEN